MLTIGTPAPDISLPDQDGTIQTLAERRGTWVLLYFYPQDDTPGCTKEACSFRDRLADFSTVGCAVLGVSTDDVPSHRRFADKYHLSFPILADTEKTVSTAYGAWQERSMMGRLLFGVARVSFLIDPQGIIRKVYPKVSPQEHALEILADLEALKGA